MLNLCFGKATTTDSNDSIYNDNVPVEPVFVNNKLGRIQEGLSFTINGILPQQANVFYIDFMLENPNNDIALRIAGSVEKNVLARSSRVKNVWSAEETQSDMPFCLAPNKGVQIQVLFTVPEFLVAINGFHAAKYSHRIPFHSIQRLEISGDLSDLCVEEKIVTEYPHRPLQTAHIERLGCAPCDDYDDENEDAGDEDDGGDEGAVGGLPIDAQGRPCIMERCLPLPYYATFERGFLQQTGLAIAVKGRVKTRPQVFTVSIQTGINVWPPPVVALQLQLKFQQGKDGETGEPTVVRNSYVNGKWTGEISSKLATGLRPGADFTLAIAKSKKTFDIFINENLITDYAFKVNPKYVDTVLISGDLKLFGVGMDTR